MTEKEKTISDAINCVTELLDNTPNGVIIDADTILADILDSVDTEVTGLAKEIFQIWQNAADKEAVESLFAALTDVSFDEYLERCIEQSTRRECELE
ncbi:MAG TPA: hypothetical protein DEB10_13265 [Ruminococcaceae bacterium]|jgi:hypothetical protein|nr:hypothetical protein [Oscillospiraceae bacterium]